MIQSNSKIFTNSIFGTGTNQTVDELINKDRSTQESYLGSSGISHMGTKLPTLPSNQHIAKDS